MSIWLRHQPTITLNLANQAAHAAVDQAEQLGLRVSIVVVDGAGFTIQMAHMDGAPRPSQAIALNKALKAAGFGRSTAHWSARVEACSKAVQTGLPLQPDMALFGGGEPFLLDGEVIGAIGISGASEEDDSLCALAATAKIAHLLA